MELGIDIGGLNGVLLGNVPPGPANHRQRAGRAGRRSDGSAVVVTYSRNSDTIAKSSADLEIFFGVRYADQPSFWIESESFGDICMLL